MNNIFVRALRRLRATLRLGWLALTDRRGYQVIRHVQRGGLSFLGLAALLDLYEATQRIERAQTPGLFIETGTALGGSGLVIAAAKAPNRPLFLYDVFGLIPPPSVTDGESAQQRYSEIRTGSAAGIKDGVYYGYQTDLLATVQNNFQTAGFDQTAEAIIFVQGLYQETLQIDQPVALAHIDCDWYDSVKICLERIVPQLSPGGLLVLDDYLQWPGCKQAVDEYFTGQRDNFIFVMHARLHIIRR
jgi:predicted O-methyltransferase YrrM